MGPKTLLEAHLTQVRDGGQVGVVGSMNADYTVTAERFPQPGETIQGGPMSVLPGGKSGNQAASAARLGATVRLFGALGSDANAEFLFGKLADAGVGTGSIRRVAGPSGTTMITVDSHGENTIVYSPGSNAAVDAGYIRSVSDDLLRSAVLGLCLESPMGAVREAARICHEHGIPVLLNDSPFVPSLPADLVTNTDILLVNEHETAQLLMIAEPEDGDWASADWNAIAGRLHRFGYGKAVVTLGERGSMVIDGDRVAPVPAIRVDAVDATGCGDAFMGTILAGLAAGLSLEDSASLASCVSAYAATGYGAQASYGSAEQIADFIGQKTR